MHANLLGEAKTWITTEPDILSSLTNNTDFPYPKCNPQLLYQLLPVASRHNAKPTLSSTLIGAHIRVCCFCRSAPTRSQTYSNHFMSDTKMFLPKKMQCCIRELLEGKTSSVVETKPKLFFSVVVRLCCCESPAIHINNIRRFLRLILKASYIKAKQ